MVTTEDQDQDLLMVFHTEGQDQDLLIIEPDQDQTMLLTMAELIQATIQDLTT